MVPLSGIQDLSSIHFSSSASLPSRDKLLSYLSTHELKLTIRHRPIFGLAPWGSHNILQYLHDFLSIVEMSVDGGHQPVLPSSLG